MDVRKAELRARQLMDSHGLNDWHFAWTRSVRNYGDCNLGYRRIRLSKPLTEANAEDQVLDTILHEIAHALAEPESDHHGPKWRTMARKIGANPEAIDTTGVRAPSKWMLECPECGFAYPRYRRTATRRSCPKCWPSWNPAFELRWIATEEYAKR